MPASARRGPPGPVGPQGPPGPPGSGEDPAVAVEAHRVDTTAVHGIADTAALVLAGHGHVIADVTGLQAALDGLTDPAELAAAITAAVNAHAATDATDAELIAAIAAEVANRDAAIAAATASLTADIATKQDAATAATDAELSAHTGDTALDGGPHGLPALGSDGMAWVRQGGALVAVDVATQAELDAVEAAHDARLDSVESGDAWENGQDGWVLTYDDAGNPVWAEQVGGGGSTPDADATTKGKLQLAGDLGGTAAAPTVPGLAAKQDAATAATDAELAAGLALKQDASTAATDAELTAHTGSTSNPHSVTKSQVGLGNAENTSDANKPVSTAQQTALNAKQAISEKGNASGYASLDGSGKVPASQMAVSALEYQGTWNASTNSPTLADGTGTKGELYRVTAAGSQNLGAGSIAFDVGDYAIHNGTTWEKADTTDAVASVAGRTGAVTLAKADVGLGNVDNTADSAKPVSTAQQSALDAKQGLDTDLTAIAGLSPSNDDVVQRKSGVWVARSMAQVKTDLALAKGDVGLGNVDNTADAAKPVSTAQQTALDAKQNAASVAADSGVTAHLADSSDAHDASAISFSPTGTVAATDVQAAIAEAASEGGGASAPRVVAGGNLGATETLDLDGDPEVWLVGTLDANLTLTLDNPPAGSCAAKLLLVQDGTGGWTLAVDDGSGPVAVTIPDGPDEVVVVDITSPDGTDFYVAVAGGAGKSARGLNAGQELGYDESVSDQTTTSTVGVPFDPPMIIEIEVEEGDPEFEVIGRFEFVSHGSTGGTSSLDLYENGVLIGSAGGRSYTGGAIVGCSVDRRRALAPGTYTYELYKRASTGTATFWQSFGSQGQLKARSLG